MPTVFEVAKYILNCHGPMSAMKLQKLVYYSQAWSLAWDEAPIFQERLEAWANGPVSPDLYQRHKGKFEVDSSIFSDVADDTLNEDQKETIAAVLASYGDKSPKWLSDQTHIEDPWKNARLGIPDGERSNKEITLASLSEYYSSLN